jgi:hypothetical protein
MNYGTEEVIKTREKIIAWRHNILTKSFSIKRGKNYRRQSAKFYYIESVYKHHRLCDLP